MTPLLDKRQPDDVVFAALSTGPRRTILVALKERGRMSRAELEDLLPNLSHEAIGRHLNALVGAGLAVRSGQARGTYRRDDAVLKRALRRLDHGPRDNGRSPGRRTAI